MTEEYISDSEEFWDKTADYCNDKFGEILEVKFKYYYKYEFIIEISTSFARKYILHVGGTADDIYKYNPLLCDWDEHLAAGINTLCRLQ